ncbi:polyprenol monophosphomannose synthase [Acetobacteraceae bacterium ESL0709]|nr:polyprenol monophosphomannose synthase [Acetobacteraceae bacterium ESL0697]MDF7678921.1 polyprenol monophosphomannose synthase [Acetobacteraceae bacterium ESL0709]
MEHIELSIIVPCLDESGNIVPFTEAVKSALPDVNWEIVFVDDNSRDGTIGEIRSLARVEPRVRGILRLRRKGLSSAVIEGALSVSSPYIAVMDGDLQHDESCLRPMLNFLRLGEADLVVASRYVEGGGTQGLSGSWRRFLSKTGIQLVAMLSRVTLSDPMSGFFMMKRSLFEETAPFLSGKGFKILLDIVLNTRSHMTIAEVPMVFRKRLYGQSKLGLGVMVSFGVMVVKSALRRRFLS